MPGLTDLPKFNATCLKKMGEASPDANEPKAPGRLGGIQRDPRTTRRAEKRRLVRAMRENAAAEHIGALPEVREDVVLVMTGGYHGFDVLAAVLDLAGCNADEVWVATLGFNKSQTDVLSEMCDAGRIGKLHFVVSDMFREMNRTEFGYLRDSLIDRGHRCEVTRNHAKLMLFKLADGRHLVTHGSLNLRRCNSFEQLVITQDAELYRFFAEFLEDAITGRVEP